MHRESGFTMMELIIVIALLVVVSAVSIPGFIDYLPNYRLKAASQDLYSNFQRAKLKAVEQNTNTAVSFSSTGYVIFVDADEDFVQDGGETQVLQITWTDYKSVSVDSNTFDASAASSEPCIAFQPNGIPADNSGGLANGSVTLENTNGRTMTVSVSQAGGVRIQ